MDAQPAGPNGGRLSVPGLCKSYGNSSGRGAFSCGAISLTRRYRICDVWGVGRGPCRLDDRDRPGWGQHEPESRRTGVAGCGASWCHVTNPLAHFHSEPSRTGAVSRPIPTSSRFRLPLRVCVPCTFPSAHRNFQCDIVLHQMVNARIQV